MNEKTYKDFEQYKANPFLNQVLDTTKPGVKRILGKSNDEMMIVSQKTGELLNSSDRLSVGFFKNVEVDRTEFIKLYVNGVSAIAELSGAGNKVFKIVCNELQKYKDKDQITLAFNLVDQEQNKISKPTFYKGLTELLEKNFIAKTNAINVFFINPSYIFNGDRLAFVKSYSVVKKPKKIKEDTKQINFFE